jgi:titin
MLYGSLYGRDTSGPTPPDSPEPVLIAWDETGAGPIVVGSWSESVTVTVEGVDQSGAPAPVATVSGSGAGPYSMSVASGLESGKVYGYTLTGAASSGSSVVTVALAVRMAPLAAPTPPAQGPPEASGTATVTRTWTHPGAPASGITYVLVVTDTATGDPITPVSGSGLGPYVIPVSNGLGAMAVLAAVRTLDLQEAAADPHWIEVSESPALSWAAPAAASVTAGNTSAVLTWTTPTGGTAPYEYSDPGVVYDSQAASTTASLSTAGAGAGATTVSGLVNGQTVVMQRTVTDANGTSRVVQGAVTVAATAAGVTSGAAPAGQALAAGTTTVTIGTWGAASGGTAPYNYALTESSGSGVTISGSGLGPYTAAGLVDGQTYVFLLTITDAALVKGYSVVTVSVSPSSAMGRYEVLAECDFTDADWTALSSTDATVNASAWQHILYAADGVTPRAYVLNGSSQARTLGLSPSGSGLSLTNGTSTATPSIFVWPANWTPLLGASRRDVWLIEAIIEGEEPSGSTTFAHVQGISTGSGNANASPMTGYIARSTASNTAFRAASYISAFDEQSIQTVTTGATRLYRASVQVTIADFRRHDVHSTLGVTDYRDPQTGQRVRVQTASTTMSTVGAEAPTSAAWGGTSIGGRTKWGMWHDGTATSGSRIRLRKLRLLRMPLGSM